MATEFWVWNDTDGVSASPEPFVSRDDAVTFIAEYRERYRERGYQTSRGVRIAADAIELRITESEAE